MEYCRLTREERYQIDALLASGMSTRGISRQLKRNVSTISREIQRGRGKFRTYSAYISQKRNIEQIHRPRMKTRKIKGNTEEYIREKLLLDWSPQQIAGRMNYERLKLKVSYLSIYRYLERDKLQKGELWTHLRIKKKGKQRYQGGKLNRLSDRVMIEKRPGIVEERKRLGDYERDTVLGKFNGSVLLTIVDRTSRKAKIVWLPKKCSKLVHKATVSRLKNEPCKTITNDNGGEFTRHKDTSKRLGINVFFANAYRAWERGSNENFNGLLRQYFPKREDIGTPTQSYIRYIENKLNNRPRKCLGYRTPTEVHKSLDRRVLRW